MDFWKFPPLRPDPRPGRWLGEFRLPSTHSILKRILGLWAIGYPILIFLPLLSTGTDAAGATTAGVLAGPIVGATLFFPWLVGIIVLWVLAWVTKPSPASPDGDALAGGRRWVTPDADRQAVTTQRARGAAVR